MHALAAAISLFLIATPALAASPKVDGALKTLQAVGADPGKLKTFCEFMDVDEKLGDKSDAALEGQMDKLLDQLGTDFKAAWETIEDTDERSPDGRALSAAVDQLEDKCPN
jgi:hypothetical protein